MNDRAQQESSQDRRLRGWCWLLHLYTASGAVLGLLALQAAHRGDAKSCWGWLFLALVVDSSDGTLARRLRVWERLPGIDGRRLDDIVDYFNYVIVPIYALVSFGLLPDTPLIWGLPILASALGFANVEAKTDDDYFLGFPSYWNLVAIYLHALAWPSWVNAAIIVVLAALVFAPISFIYPSKTVPYRVPTLILGGIWAMQTVALVLVPDQLPAWWLPSSLFYPVYYLSLSLHLHRHRKRAPQQ